MYRLQINSEPSSRKRPQPQSSSHNNNNWAVQEMEQVRYRRRGDGGSELMPDAETETERAARLALAVHYNLQALTDALQAAVTAQQRQAASYMPNAERDTMRATPFPVPSMHTTLLAPGRPLIQHIALVPHPFLRLPPGVFLHVYFDAELGRYAIVQTAGYGAAPATYGTAEGLERAVELARAAFCEAMGVVAPQAPPPPPQAASQAAPYYY